MNPSPLTLVVSEDEDGFVARWPGGDALLSRVAEIFLDLVPFMVARLLLARGYDADRLLIVRLQGADRDMLSAALGAAAATPVLNSVPVRQAARIVYPRDARNG